MVFRKGGIPPNRSDTPEKIRKSFYRLVKVGDTAECWIWQGQMSNRRGYGRMRICGKNKGAHRISYEIHHGPIKPGLMICHSCDNPKCVNPHHLFQGTSRDNKLDCTSKMRHAYGDKSPNAVLTEDAVREIKAAYKAGTLNQREAARKHGVSWGLIGHIVHGRAWTHV